MSQERIHYWAATDKVFHAAVLAAAQAGVDVAEWVCQAVDERLQREAEER